MTWKYNIEMGLMVDPQGIILDGPHAGTTVSLTHISLQPADGSDNHRMGNFLNPEILTPLTVQQPAQISSEFVEVGE